MKFKKGVSTILVEKEWVSQKESFVVKKILKTWNKYKKERDFYLFTGCLLDFVPKLFKFDDESKTIWTEYCGISLNLKYEPKQRYKFKQKIRSLVSKLQAIGLYHNDIRWKNIVESDSGELFLIDFESVSTDNKERDPEYILRDKL